VMNAILVAVASALAGPSGLNVSLFENSGLAGPPSTSFIEHDTSRLTFPPHALSAIVSGTLTFPSLGTYQFECDFRALNVAFVWIDGHLLCQDGAYNTSAGSTDNPLPVRRVKSFAFRIHVYKDAGSLATVAVRWGKQSEPDFQPVPTSALSAHLSLAEQERDAIQRAASEGWGNMLHANMLTFTNLPSGAALTIGLCQRSTGKCIMTAVPDGLQRCNTSVRVGPYATDRSYDQYYFGGGPPLPYTKNVPTLAFGNLSIAFTAGRTALSALATPIGCDAVNCSDLTLRLNGRFLWRRAGTVASSSEESSLLFTPGGNLPAFRVHISSAAAVWEAGEDLHVSLERGAIGLSTDAARPAPSVTALGAAISAARAAHAAHLLAAYNGSSALAEVATGVEAAAMWTAISTPAENGHSVLMPVSRAWSRVPPAPSADWCSTRPSVGRAECSALCSLFPANCATPSPS